MARIRIVRIVILVMFLTVLFIHMIAVCRPEEKKVTYAISNRNDEVKKKQEETRKLLDEIAREIELTCGQGKSC